MLEIIHAATPGRIAATQELFLDYQLWLGPDLRFQNFSAELATLPGAYDRPFGRLLLAMHRDFPVGCVALRRIDDATCEMKRLFVRPEFQSLKVGRALAQRIVAEARATGYTRMYLETLPEMTRARRLCASLSFREIPPYRHNPVPGAIFMELILNHPS